MVSLMFLFFVCQLLKSGTEYAYRCTNTYGPGSPGMARLFGRANAGLRGASAQRGAALAGEDAGAHSERMVDARGNRSSADLAFGRDRRNFITVLQEEPIRIGFHACGWRKKGL